MSSDSDLQRLIDTEAEHSEVTRNDPIPDEALAAARRPNLARSVTFTVRLNPDEVTGIRDAAQRHGIPPSTLVRGWVVRELAAEKSGPTDAAQAVDRLEDDVRALRRLVAS